MVGRKCIPLTKVSALPIVAFQVQSILHSHPIPVLTSLRLTGEVKYCLMRENSPQGIINFL